MENKMLNKIINMQIKLNNLSAGKSWKNGIAKNGKAIDWGLCIAMETAELIDSTDWKHWKHSPEDIDNIRIELVDILHFLISETVRYKKNDSLEDISKFISFEFNKMLIDDISKNYSINFVSKKLLQFSLNISLKNGDYLENLEGIYYAFKFLALKYFKDFDELFKFYLGKNILNEFRQKNGYNDGSYKKIWFLKKDKKNPYFEYINSLNGREDNVFMTEYLKRNNIDGLLEFLEINYKSLIS